MDPVARAALIQNARHSVHEHHRLVACRKSDVGRKAAPCHGQSSWSKQTDLPKACSKQRTGTLCQTTAIGADGCRT